MTKNQSLIAFWENDPVFQKEVATEVIRLRRDYPSRHHGYQPSAAAIAAWRYDVGLRVASRLQSKRDHEIKARIESEAAERKAAFERIFTDPLNVAWRKARNAERKLWRRAYKAHLRGERPCCADLEALVASAEALVVAAQVRANAGLDRDEEREGAFGHTWVDHDVDLGYAKAHLNAAKELMDLHKVS